MRALFNHDGPLFSLGEQLFDIMAASVLWVICCIPVVTFIPATSALYYVAVKQVRKHNGSLLNNFFGSFRDSLRNGIPLSCIVLIYATVIFSVIWELNGLTEKGWVVHDSNLDPLRQHPDYPALLERLDQVAAAPLG